MRLATAVLGLTLTLVLVAWGAARAAPPVEGYFSCQAITHPHIHISEPSQGHARRHRCKRVAVDPLTAAPERQAGPRPETATEAHYRIRAQAAERRVQELGKEVDAANSRTEQVRKDTEAAVAQKYEPYVAEVLDLRGWAEQLERAIRFYAEFLPEPQRTMALALVNSR